MLEDDAVRLVDHPRSRGVYAATNEAGGGVHGSSPLARGLPIPLTSWSRRPRIIPARAGFTLFAQRFGEAFRDHPRSRGVYAHEEVLGPRLQGSSPLARGLHGDHDVAARRGRIIPARAGFTWRRRAYRPPRQDHPRSRGVYRIQRIDVENRPRIIPARAGFTFTRPLKISLMMDHPRSRGVYTGYVVAQGSGTGSSPLARGLPMISSPR